MPTCMICYLPASGRSLYCNDHKARTTITTYPCTVPQATSGSVSDAIGRRCDAIRDLLRAKNLAYGNSATDPVRIFSRASADEQLRVRIDDKLSRLAKGNADAFGEDVVVDLIGYLVLLLVFRDMQKPPTAWT